MSVYSENKEVAVSCYKYNENEGKFVYWKYFLRSNLPSYLQYKFSWQGFFVSFFYIGLYCLMIVVPGSLYYLIYG